MAWVTITADDLKAAGYGAVVDAAQTQATGTVDPVTIAIASAVARVRRAVKTGNPLDANEAKVPASLQDLAMRYAYYMLMQRIELPLTKDQEDQKKEDGRELERIARTGERVEAPDEPAGQGEMTGQPSPRILPKDRNFNNRTTDGI